MYQGLKTQLNYHEPGKKKGPLNMKPYLKTKTVQSLSSDNRPIQKSEIITNTQFLTNTPIRNKHNDSANHRKLHILSHRQLKCTHSSTNEPDKR